MKTYTTPIFVPIKLAGGGTGGSCKVDVLSTDEGCVVFDEDFGVKLFTDKNNSCEEKSICYDVPQHDTNIYNS